MIPRTPLLRSPRPRNGAVDRRHRIVVPPPVRDRIGQAPIGGRGARSGRPVHFDGCRFSAQDDGGRRTGYPIVDPPTSTDVFELGRRGGILSPPAAGPPHALDQCALHSFPARKRTEHLQRASQTVLGNVRRGRRQAFLLDRFRRRFRPHAWLCPAGAVAHRHDRRPGLVESPTENTMSAPGRTGSPSRVFRIWPTRGTGTSCLHGCW